MALRQAVGATTTGRPHRGQHALFSMAGSRHHFVHTQPPAQGIPAPDAVADAVTVEGDEALGHRIVANLAYTI